MSDKSQLVPDLYIYDALMDIKQGYTDEYRVTIAQFILPSGYVVIRSGPNVPEEPRP